MNALSGIRFAPQIEIAARSHGLDPKLLAAVAAQETGGPGSNSGANIVGDRGHGHGVFQIDDRWHAFARSSAAMDPAKNADYAAGMLSGLIRQFGGSVKEALSAYNSGSPKSLGTVTTWGDGTRLGYANSVMRHYADLGGDPAALGAELSATQSDTAGSASALAGLANASTPGGQATPASPAAAPPAMPMSNFEIMLPQPSPYPTQYRSYTSISGMDTNGPQQLDALMTGMIDGADGLSTSSES